MEQTEDVLIESLVGKRKTRPTLGRFVDIRVLQVRLALLAISPGAGDLLLFAGKKIGEAQARKLGRKGSLKEGIGIYFDYLKETKVAIPELARCNEKGAVIRGYECAFSYGLPNIGECVCTFDAGFQAGFLSEFTGMRIISREVKCNANGDDYCEFVVKVVELEEKLAEAFRF